MVFGLCDGGHTLAQMATIVAESSGLPDDVSVIQLASTTVCARPRVQRRRAAERDEPQDGHGRIARERHSPRCSPWWTRSPHPRSLGVVGPERSSSAAGRARYPLRACRDGVGTPTATRNAPIDVTVSWGAGPGGRRATSCSPNLNGSLYSWDNVGASTSFFVSNTLLTGGSDYRFTVAV